MKKLKSLFSSPKKAAVTILCIAVIISILAAGTVLVANAYAKSTSIGAENAKNFAFADAGVDPVSAENVRTEFDFEHGQFVYEVDFIANGTEYEYWIKASDGTVVKKEQEVIRQMAPTTAPSETTAPAQTTELPAQATAVPQVTELPAQVTTPPQITELPAQATTPPQVTAPPVQITAPPAQNPGAASYISIDQAKSIAVGHAGLSVSEVRFSKAKLENDDGYTVYEIEFYKDRMEYEYTINATDGSILEYDSDWDD